MAIILQEINWVWYGCSQELCRANLEQNEKVDGASALGQLLHDLAEWQRALLHKPILLAELIHAGWIQDIIHARFWIAIILVFLRRTCGVLAE